MLEIAKISPEDLAARAAKVDAGERAALALLDVGRPWDPAPGPADPPWPAASADPVRATASPQSIVPRDPPPDEDPTWSWCRAMRLALDGEVRVG